MPSLCIMLFLNRITSVLVTDNNTCTTSLTKQTSTEKNLINYAILNFPHWLDGVHRAEFMVYSCLTLYTNYYKTDYICDHSHPNICISSVPSLIQDSKYTAGPVRPKEAIWCEYIQIYSVIGCLQQNHT